MAIKGYFFNAEESGGVYDRVYNAEDMTSYLDGIVGNGVFLNPSNSLQVVPKSGRTVTVKKGAAWINGHKIVLTQDMDLETPAKTSGARKIASIIVAANMTSREMQIYVKVGSLATTRPSLTRTSSLYEMGLADIDCVFDEGTVDVSKISDTRLESERCGVVQGLIQQESTTSLFEAWQTAFETWFTGVKSAFVAGTILQRREGICSVTESGRQFNVQNYIPTYNPLVDLLEVYVNGIHQTGAQYSIADAYVIFVADIPAGSTIDFVAYKLNVPS